MKLKIADIVWVIKKIYHIIEAIESITIVYIDHLVTVFITQQISLNTIIIEKLNLQLICTSEYLQQFCLNIQYKSNKTNIILDALLRLISQNYHLKSEKAILKALHSLNVSIFLIMLIKVFNEFYKYLMNEYKKSQWKRIKDII